MAEDGTAETGVELDERMGALRARVAEVGSMLVAFSGGADSALLLAVAAQVLGPHRAVAATAVSPSLPSAELTAARELAAGLGVEHVLAGTAELDRPGYVANAGDRCYFCKSELVDVLLPLAAERGLAAVATGTNADDAVAGFRPGIRAAAERGAVTPLLDAGLTKAQVRAASRALGLSTWDKPAAACLSSRIAYGVPVSAERLVRVERAEVAVRRALVDAGAPSRDLRVRDLGRLDGADTARLEVDADVVEVASGLATVRDAVLAAGFEAVQVDPRGFRSGSMNEVLLPVPGLR